MRAWSGDQSDAMGPSVEPRSEVENAAPPLKNGSDLRESGYLIAVGSRTARFRRKHRSKLITIFIIFAILFLLCLAITMTVLYVKQKKNKGHRLCESKECLRSAANLAMSLDRTANPCEDFHQYVCGNWVEDHPRPDAYRSYDWFRDKQIKVYTAVRDFLGKNTTEDHPEPVKQAKDMFAACMDTDTLNQRGLTPVLEILSFLGLPPYPTYLNITEDFDYTTYTFDWLEIVIKIKTYLGMDVLVGFDIFTDPKNSSIYRLIMGSPETIDPFPSIHLEKKKHLGSKNEIFSKLSLLKQYQDTKVQFYKEYNSGNKHAVDKNKNKPKGTYEKYYADIIKLFVLESDDVKQTKLSETELDQNILEGSSIYYNLYHDFSTLENENDTKTDDNFNANIPDYTVDEIQTLTDAVVENNNGNATPIWRKYLEDVFSISNVELNYDEDRILVSDLDLKYMALMAAMVAKLPPVQIELYIWVKVVSVMAVHTTSELRMLFQKAYDQLNGDHSDVGVPPRSLQCANAVNDMMGLAVAYGIADPKFLNVTKPKIKIMLHEMKNSLSRLVGKVKWMDDNTKIATYNKIEKMKTLIGFPDWLLEDGKLEEYYQGLEVDREKHIENMISLIQVKLKIKLNKFRKVNNYTWATDPTEVNAYHTFQENTITVPMVMLQYPFYDLGLDSLNYGSLGTVLGHEITHGFDNFGRQFDINGNLLPWWSNSTVESFVNMTQCFIDQYSSYLVPELNEYLNGEKTLGENIADNGGVREAFSAFKEHLHKYGPELKLPGFEDMNSEQLFFLSFGNLWCGTSTKESLRAELDDEHSPQAFRSRGALQNNIDFAHAWKCPPGSKMNPKNRCIIF